MNISLVCGCAFVAAIVTVLLKKYSFEYSFIISICAVSLICLYILASVLPSLDSINSIINNSGLDSNYLKIMLKCVGICFLTEFSCDCCKDASQTALSNAVLTSGRICVLLTALPLFREFLDFVLKLSGGSV